MISIKPLALAAIFSLGLSGAALALDGYPSSVVSSFTGWCTGEGYTASVCNCAVSKAAVEIPVVAMTTFLAAPEGSASASVSAGVGGTALQIAATCAASGAASNSTINSLGSSLFGK